MIGANGFSSLPLASVIIDNYNFGCYLKDAVESVFAQTYPNIECIIVDDASTDESPKVLDEIAAAHPSAKIIRRRENGDQLATCLDGFAASRGDYVLFLDSDDVLLKHCIATHVFVHLSLRRPVGFSCGDLLQAVAERVVLGGNESVSSYVLGTAPPRADTRPAGAATSGAWAEGVDRLVLDRVYGVEASCRTWPWTATSAFFFRRDALNLWVGTPGLAQIRRSTDGFFGRAVNAVTGSVLIDESLGVLRIHGANNFTKHPQLNNLRNYDHAKEREGQHRRLILEELTRDPSRFPFHHPDLLKKSLLAADTAGPTSDAPAWAQASHLSHLLVARYATLAPIFGAERLTRWMLERGIPPKALRKAGIPYSRLVAGKAILRARLARKKQI